MSSLDIGSIPPEIWNEIFNLACRDDGTTAISLSQVSRRIRALSEQQRYLSVQIKSTSQLFKLQDTLTSKGKLDMTIPQSSLRTRFLCVVLPESTMEQAYPEDSFAPEDDPEDQSWRGCRFSREDADPDEEISSSGEGSSTSEEFDSDDSEFEYEPVTNGSDGELNTEIADLQHDALRAKTPPMLTIKDLSELQDTPTASSQYEYRVFSAIRRLLEACCTVLEAFTLWFCPKCLIPLELLVPRLPSLKHLSIGVESATWTLARSPKAGQAPAQLFPALCRLRMFAKYTPRRSIAWWKDVVQLAAGRSETVKITTSLSKKA